MRIHAGRSGRGVPHRLDVGSALEGSTASLVTTVRIDVDATNRETLLDWLRVVDDERASPEPAKPAEPEVKLPPLMGNVV